MSLRPLLFVLALALVPAPAAAGDRASDLQHEIVDVVAAAREELHALDELLDAADSRSVQKELRRKAARIDELLAEIPRLSARLERASGHSISTSAGVGVSVGGLGGEVVVVVDDSGPAPVVVVDEHPDASPRACSPGDFAGVLSAVEKESFSSGKLERLEDATVDRWYTSAQVRRMLDLFSFDNDKVEAAVVMHPRVVDMENWFRVHDAFTFDSSKDELRKRVGR